MSRDGFSLVKNVPSREDAELAALLGLVAIPTAMGNGDTLFFDISPDNNRSADVSSTPAEFPLHTDSTFFAAPHDMLGLACCQNTPVGGESLLVGAADVVVWVREIGGPEAVAALQDPVYPFYLRDPLVGHGLQLVPILVADGDTWRVRYRGDIVKSLIDKFDISDVHRQAFAILEQVLTSAWESAQTIHLEPDDLILIDNRRTLHARTALGPGERRLRRTKGYLLHASVGRLI